MILVTGSTGFVGRTLVPALVEAGWPVRVFVVPGRGDSINLPWSDIPLDVVTGSILEYDDVLRAMDGVHTVFHLASALWWGSPRDLEHIELTAAHNVIRAAQAMRIGRLHVLSQLGAAQSSAYALLRVKGEMESRVLHSGLPYTIIRSGIIFGKGDRFVNNIAMLLRSNPVIFLQPGQGENLLHPIYVHDLVQAMVNSLENLATVDRIIEVGGPEYLTFNEMVRTVMRVIGAQRVMISMPPYALRFITRVLSVIFPRWPASLQWFDLVASHRTAGLGNMFDVFGIKPVRFEDTLLTYMPKRRYTLEFLRFLLRRWRPREV